MDSHRIGNLFLSLRVRRAFFFSSPPLDFPAWYKPPVPPRSLRDLQSNT